jgi:hypothetical protein
MEHWLSKEFAGQIDVTLGTGWFAYFGTYFRNTFGTEITLATNPVALVKGFPAGDTTHPLLDLALGLGDGVEFCYGQHIRATYGGPTVDITRGPYLRLHSPAAFGWNRDMWVQTGDYSEDMETTEEESVESTAILALGVVTNLVTAITELYIRFEYESYNEYTGGYELYNSTSNTPAGLKAAKYVMEGLGPRLMALQYYLEVCCGWTALSTYSVKEAAAILSPIAVKLQLFGEWLAAAGTRALGVCSGLLAQAMEIGAAAGEALTTYATEACAAIAARVEWLIAECSQISGRTAKNIALVVFLAVIIATDIGIAIDLAVSN